MRIERLAEDGLGLRVPPRVQQKKSAAAAQVRTQFEEAWKSAEAKLKLRDL